jgi:5-methylcytosine-specific restriction enzyme subunit McrC
MIEIPLTEGRQWSPTFTLTPGQEAAVCRTKDVKRDRLPGGQWRFRTHQTAPKIGAITLGREDDAVLFRIAPKFPILRLMFLVEYAKQNASAQWDDAEVTAREEEGIVAAIARAFGRAGDRALRSRVLNGYHEVNSDEMTMRGRMRVGDQALRGSTLGPPVALSYDDFTPDIPENRLLLAAARKLLQLPKLKDVQGMLWGIEKQLSGVSPLRPGETWRPTRMNAHYYRALNLADLVLRDSSYELDGNSGVRTDGLLISMSQLYEDFVGVALERALEQYGFECLTKQDHRLDQERKLPAQTDFECYAPGDSARPAAIVDAKYTVLGGKSGRSRHVQQIISYCYALEARHGFLVYAQGGTDPIPHHVRDIEVTEYPLDLNQPPAELLRQIDDLAQRIAGTSRL